MFSRGCYHLGVTMPDRRQWMTPGLIKEVVVAILMIGGTIWTIQSKVDILRKDNDRLEAQLNEQAKNFKDSIADLRGDLKSLQAAQGDVIRAQERMAALTARIESLESFQAAQTDYNTKFLTSLAVLKKGG